MVHRSTACTRFGDGKVVLPSPVTPNVPQPTMNDRNRNARLWWLGVSAFVICVLFFRGNYLLGTSTAVAFAFISLAIATIGYRNLIAQRTSRAGIVVYSVFSICCVAVMVSPASFSPTLQHFIDKQAAERTARNQISALIRDNAEYRDIRIETEQLKAVFVSIEGSVPDRLTADRLVADLSRMDFTEYCILHGKIAIRDSGEIREFTDDDLVHDPEKTLGNQAVNVRTGKV